MTELSKTPRTDALINEGAASQNEYITKALNLARTLEVEIARLQSILVRLNWREA